MAIPASAAVIQTVPLSHLFLAPENVRATPPSKSAQAELKASVFNHGLLENLVVRESDPARNGDPRFGVLAGGRRLAVLQELASEGDIPTDHPIPCIVATADTPAEEISLAENVVRLAMHPADQVSAFSRLLDAGASVTEVATRFGVSQRLVKQRMRLGNAAPEIIQAFRDDRIDMETLQAFSLTTDHTRQMAVWEQLSGLSYRPNAYQVSRMLTSERVPSGAAIAQFVGINAYKAAGGTFLRDLFSTRATTWLDNPDLLNELAMAKLTEEAEKVSADWKWAVPMIEVEWATTAQLGRVYPVPAEPTEDEQKAIDKHRERIARIEATAEEDWTEELGQEHAAAHSEIARIDGEVASRAAYTDEDRAIAGCIVTIDRDGALRTLTGLVHPDDMPEEPEEDTASTGTPPGPDPDRYRAPADRSPDPHAAARKAAGIGIGLADDMRAIRTTTVKAHLQKDFEAAFDLLAFQMARAVFAQGYNYQPTSLDISFSRTQTRPTNRVNDRDFDTWNPDAGKLDDVSDLPFDWLEDPSAPGCFEAFRALSMDDKQKLFAAAVARTLKGQLAFEHAALPEFESTVARLDIDFASQIRPTADMFWSRINKSQLLDIARETLGPDWAATHSKQKKTELASAMEKAFAAGEVPLGVTAAGHAAALAWAPPGFAAFNNIVDPPAGQQDTGDGSEASAASEAPDIPEAANDDTETAPAPEVPEFLRNVS